MKNLRQIVRGTAAALAVLFATGCSTPEPVVIGISSSWNGWSAGVDHAYVDAIRDAGGIAVILPMACTADEAEALMQVVDGVVMTGGEDVDPARYGQEVLNESVYVNDERDTSDFHIAEAALRHHIPLLGICRGEQLLGVVLGGTLWQDIPSQVGTSIDHGQGAHMLDQVHPVTVDRSSRLYALLQADTLWVNSSHHQGVRTPGPETKTVARAADGVTEAIEAPGVLAVQFHPEYLVKGGHDAFMVLFEDLIARAKEYQRTK